MITFDVSFFRTMFPPYSNATTFPDNILQMYWDNATAYMTDEEMPFSSFSLTLQQQTLSLNLLTAHLTYLNNAANSGQTGGIVQSATVDKVSVDLTPPPVPNQWQWWLNQSPYGQQILALLQSRAVGGGYFGGFCSANTIRR